MKTLTNRSLSNSDREDVIGMAEDMFENYEGSIFHFLRISLKDKYNELGIISEKPAYTSTDAMYQSFSDRQSNFYKTGRF